MAKKALSKPRTLARCVRAQPVIAGTGCAGERGEASR